MYQIDNQFPLDQMRGLISHALRELEQSDLAFLFASGKSELEIRNQIALHMHRNVEYPTIVTREWRRHDLAVLDKNDPVFLIEGKAWIHSDAVSPTKLRKGNTSILHALESDIQKMRETAQLYPSVRQYITIVLSTTDVLEAFASDEARALVKYASTHKKGLTKFKSMDELVDNANGRLGELLDSYGDFMRLPILNSDRSGMRVKADIFVLDVTPKNNLGATAT